MIEHINFKDLHKFSKDIKVHKLFFYDEKVTPNTINSGNYDNQPFFIEKINESIILFFNTEIDVYVKHFADAVSNKIKKAPCFSYIINPEKLKCVEWTNDEGDRYEKLSLSERIIELKFYE